jgi:amidase
MDAATFAEHDGMGLAELVRRGEASPAELVEAAIERIEAVNPQLNAVVHESFERAREQAKGELPDGPFRGVPFLLKDLHGEDTGQPTTSSTRLLAKHRATFDSELVKRFKAAGVVILGRTNTPEFGIYGVTEPELHGPTRNPWNTDHTPGGSSGGSAAAVAARMVPLAHGGDGGGSIRIPASHCGLVGLRPTRARNPMGPWAGERWAGFVSEHVLTRSVRDTAAMLDATRGPDVGAPYQVRAPERDYLEEVEREPGKLRIAYTREALFGDETHPDCLLVEAKPTFDKQELIKAFLLTVATDTATAVRAAGEIAGKTPKAGDFEKPTWLLKLLGDKLSAAEYRWQQQRIQRAGREVGAFFADHDVFLTPTVALPPLKIGELAPSGFESFQLSVLHAAPAKGLLMKALDVLAVDALRATPNTMLFNMTGQPAISLPLHWSEAGLPLGTQWVGRFGDEATLIRLAAQLERARPWKDRKPALLEGLAPAPKPAATAPQES